MRLIREVFSFDLPVSNATLPRWLPSCATHSRTSAERKMRTNTTPQTQRRKIHIKRKKWKVECSISRQRRPFGGICLLTSGVILASFLLSLPFSLVPHLLFLHSYRPTLASAFFIFNTLREETLLHAGSRGEDVPLTAYTNPRLPQQPGELFPFRFPISLQLALSKRVRAVAQFVKAELWFLALILGTMSGT